MFQCLNLFASLYICMASSRVGASMSAMGPSSGASSCWSIMCLKEKKEKHLYSNPYKKLYNFIETKKYIVLSTIKDEEALYQNLKNLSIKYILRDTP